MAIISGGITKFEIGLYGIPGIVIANNIYEYQLTKKFEKFETLSLFGLAKKFDIDEIKIKLDTFLEYKNILKMSENGRNLFDGLGGDRIFEKIK